MYRPQVGVSHYSFSSYMSKWRWASIWHQIMEVSAVEPDVVLEIGPGGGVLKSLLESMGVKVRTADIDPKVDPDYLMFGPAIPVAKSSYDVVCAFQVLEHLRYEDAIKLFSDMVRVSKRYVVVSLPDAEKRYRLIMDVPLIGELSLSWKRPFLRRRVHKFDGEHYWEVNTRGYSLRRVLLDLEGFACLVKTYRLPENPYHRFFVFILND